MDDDCEDFPNTVCRNSPVNSGLDPGTRELPFTGLVLIKFLLSNVFQPNRIQDLHVTAMKENIHNVTT